MKYRGRMQSTFEVILAIASGIHIRTHIMYRAKTSYGIVAQVLENCVENGMVCCKERKIEKRRNRLSNSPPRVQNEYYLTDKGKALAEEIKRIQKIWGSSHW